MKNINLLPHSVSKHQTSVASNDILQQLHTTHLIALQVYQPALSLILIGLKQEKYQSTTTFSIQTHQTSVASNIYILQQLHTTHLIALNTSYIRSHPNAVCSFHLPAHTILEIWETNGARHQYSEKLKHQSSTIFQYPDQSIFTSLKSPTSLASQNSTPLQGHYTCRASHAVYCYHWPTQHQFEILETNGASNDT